MFIPQLLSTVDARPTRSSSMQISLQRSAANGCMESPQESPEETLPWKPHVETHPSSPEGTPGNSPPRLPEAGGQGSNGTVCCNRRVFRTLPPKQQSEDASAASQGDEAASALNISGVRIQHRASSTDVPQVTLLPFGPEAGNNIPEPRRWSLQHVPDMGATAGKKLFVLQLQQPHTGGTGGECNFGFTGTKGDRLVRYPRIRLERSTSHPIAPPAGDGKPVDDGLSSEALSTGADTSQSSKERLPQGCLFKIRPEQKHFRILVTRGPEEQAQGLGQEGPAPTGTPVSTRLSSVRVERGSGLEAPAALRCQCWNVLHCPGARQESSPVPVNVTSLSRALTASGVFRDPHVTPGAGFRLTSAGKTLETPRV